MTVRAKTVDVLTQVRAQLQLDAQAAAGNDVLSKAEQKKLDDADVLKQSADDVRAQLSSVHVGPLVDAASSKVQELLGAVNKKTPAYVSQSEVKALATVNANAALRVAKAYELITGKHIDLPSSTPVVVPDPAPPPKTPVPAKPGRAPSGAVGVGPHVTPPASSANALGVANLTITGVTGSIGASIVGNAIELKGLAGTPATVDVDVNGEHVHAELPAGKPSTSGVGNAYAARDVVEALRAALPPDLDLRVAEVKRGAFVVDFWQKGSTPPVDNAPQYGTCTSGMMTGSLAVKFGNGPVAQGDAIVFRVDDKVYTATAQSSSATVGALLHDLKGQMEADGRTVVVKVYGPNGYASLRVTA